MKALFVGDGKGSTAVRGQQLGRLLGARVVSAPSAADLEWADVVVLIKRAGVEWATTVHRAKKPIIWDALDFWQQPAENGLSETEARMLLTRNLEAIRPSLFIGATQAMASAGGGVYLPHHAWPFLRPVSARATVTTVGYQGKRKYLGRWGIVVTKECARRGWHFAINPPDLRDCDLLVAFRDREWDGWICRAWKSGVKLVNAMAAGRPIITQASSAGDEIHPVGSVIEDYADLSDAFDQWTTLQARQAATTQLFQSYTLSAVSVTYRMLLAKTFSRMRVA